MYDEARVGGTFAGIRSHLDNLMVRGTRQEYFLDTNKIIMVVSPWNVPRAEAFFFGYVLEIVTGSRYLWVFMVMDAA